MFITFEGIDQCGKSTQVKYLCAYLDSRKIRYKVVREPGGTLVSEKIRDILLDKANDNMKFMTEFLLFSASRAQLTEEVIKPHLKKGFVVICDRYYDSSAAYQGYGGKIDLKTVNTINNIASGGIMPDLTFLINISYSVSLKRKPKENDRIERRKSAFFNKVAKGYLEIAAKNKSRFKVLDGRLSISELKEQITGIFQKHYRPNKY